MGVPSEERLLLDAALADGLWHPREELILELIPRVHVGKAHRRYEAASGRYRTDRRSGSGQKRPLTQTERIRSGARSIIHDVVNRGLRFGSYERREAPGGVELRLAAARAAEPARDLSPGPAAAGRVEVGPSTAAPTAGPFIESHPPARATWREVEDLLTAELIRTHTNDWQLETIDALAKRRKALTPENVQRRRARQLTRELERLGIVGRPELRSAG